MTGVVRRLLAKPWIWSYAGALLVWLAAIFFTRGYGAGGMITAALSLAVFTVVVGIAQMFVISLGPGRERLDRQHLQRGSLSRDLLLTLTSTHRTPGGWERGFAGG